MQKVFCLLLLRFLILVWCVIITVFKAIASFRLTVLFSIPFHVRIVSMTFAFVDGLLLGRNRHVLYAKKKLI